MTDYRQVACIGKMGFQSRKMADKSAKSGRQRGEHLDVYRCPYCRQWHVGSKDWLAPNERRVRERGGAKNLMQMIEA